MASSSMTELVWQPVVLQAVSERQIGITIVLGCQAIDETSICKSDLPLFRLPIYKSLISTICLQEDKVSGHAFCHFWPFPPRKLCP